MWPSKKDKGMTIPPGKSLEIEFGIEWRRDKDEVIIITDKEKFVLNGKNSLFLEVTSRNTDPVRVQIVPDFKNRAINIVEVIDTNAKQTTDESKGKISLAGISTSKDETVSIGELLKKWDENIEMFDKMIHRYKIRRNVFIIFGAVVTVGNVYLFTINNSPMRYLNVIAVVIIMYASFRLWNSYKDLFRVYEEYKEKRLQAFEVAKNK